MSACSTKLKDVFLEIYTIELSLTITVGHFFSENAFHIESIILNNKNKTFSNNNEIAEIFSKHFRKLKENLDMSKTLTSNMLRHYRSRF